MASSLDDIIGDILVREGGAVVTDDPADGGGRTQFGISETSNPEAWADGKVTEAEARAIYLQKYVVFPGFHRIPPSHVKVQAQLIDFGVNSGPMVAIQKLQLVLGLKQDGVLGPKTLKALTKADPRTLGNRVAGERIKMICRIVQKAPSQLKFLAGWCSRALEFAE